MIAGVIREATAEAIAEAARLVREGKPVAFPTETVYGLGADAFNERAVAKIFEVKRRPFFDPLIVHLSSEGELPRVAKEVPPKARRLAAAFWPGPLTMVLPKRPELPAIVTAGLETVAVRVPDHPAALALLFACETPIAAPSANRFGRASPTRAEHVLSQLGEDVELILDGGPCRVGVESTVVSLVQNPPAVLRLGGTPVEEITRIVGEVAVAPSLGGRAPLSPGQLPKHYAPRTPLRLLLGRAAPANVKRAGLITLLPPPDAQRFERVEVLSPSGDLRAAAANFFAAMHRLDEAGLEVIYARLLPEEGLGRAVNDRLRRAARH